MKRKKPRTPDKSDAAASQDDAACRRISPKLRDIVSIVLVAHLAIVTVSLSAAWAPSPLQVRLLTLFAPYTVPLGLNLEQRSIYLTHGRPIDMEHELQLVDGDDEVVAEMENRGLAWGERRKRRAQVAALPVRLEDYQNSEGATAIAASAAAKLLPEQTTMGRLKVVRRVPQPVPNTFPPPMQGEDAYAAAIVVDGSGGVQVTSLSDASQNAVPVQGSEAE